MTNLFTQFVSFSLDAAPCHSNDVISHLSESVSIFYIMHNPVINCYNMVSVEYYYYIESGHVTKILTNSLLGKKSIWKVVTFVSRLIVQFGWLFIAPIKVVFFIHIIPKWTCNNSYVYVFLFSWENNKVRWNSCEFILVIGRR